MVLCDPLDSLLGTLASLESCSMFDLTIRHAAVVLLPYSRLRHVATNLETCICRGSSAMVRSFRVPRYSRYIVLMRRRVKAGEC